MSSIPMRPGPTAGLAGRLRRSGEIVGASLAVDERLLVLLRDFIADPDIPAELRFAGDAERAARTIRLRARRGRHA